MQETKEAWVGSLGWEDPLEWEKTTHSSIFAWQIQWTEEPVGYSPWATIEQLNTHSHTHTHTYLAVDFLDIHFDHLNKMV